MRGRLAWRGGVVGLAEQQGRDRRLAIAKAVREETECETAI